MLGAICFSLSHPRMPFSSRCVLHNWSDENCVKILKRCREAIPSKEDGGKVIIIDMVVDGDRDVHDITETETI
ncbi:unnamed protein product [Camellia sinensis]